MNKTLERYLKINPHKIKDLPPIVIERKVVKRKERIYIKRQLELLKEIPIKCDIDKIVHLVELKYGILENNNKHSEFDKKCLISHLAKLSGYSIKQIGNKLNRKESSISYQLKKHKERIEVYQKYRSDFYELVDELGLDVNAEMDLKKIVNRKYYE